VLVAARRIQNHPGTQGQDHRIDSHGATSEVTGRMIYKYFGMELEKDSKVIALGSAAARLSVLKQALLHAIIVTPPGDAEAENLGFRAIARGFDLFSMPQSPAWGRI
jgi:hypothetical protein